MKKVVFPLMLVCLFAGILVPAGWAQAGVTSPGLKAAPVTLSWSPVNDTTIKGYALYYGPTNQPATNRLDAGQSTSATILNMLADVTYRLYAVSYNSLGVESVPSNQVLVKQPAIARLKLGKQASGSMKLTFSAAPGQVCTILFTPTLQPAVWQTLTQTTADQAGNVITLDSSSSAAKSRFYRVALGALPLLGPLQIQRQGDGSMLVAGKAPPGASCRVQYASTPDAASWQTLKTATADLDGNVTALDTAVRQNTRRFYRMAMP